MNTMKKVFSTILLLSLAIFSFGQLSTDLQVGTSQSDYSHTTLRLNYQLNNTWRIGADFQGADYRYRFIDARPIENGFSGAFKAFGLANVANNEFIRFDIGTKVGLRLVTASDEPQDFNYTFENSVSTIIEPLAIATVKTSEKLYVHAGMNMRMVLQHVPTFVFEQFPSGLILFGGSYALSDKWILYTNNHFGAMAGASGDTEKAHWSTSVGIRYNFGGDLQQNLVVGF